MNKLLFRSLLEVHVNTSETGQAMDQIVVVKMFRSSCLWPTELLSIHKSECDPFLIQGSGDTVQAIKARE